MKGSEFAFHHVHLLYHKCHRINPNCSGSYIHSSDWISKKKKKKIATINPINKKGNKCFQYTVKVVLNPKEIKKDLQRITNI